MRLDYPLLAQNCNTVLGYLFKTSDTFSLTANLIRPYSQIPPACRADPLLLPLAKDLLSYETNPHGWPGTQTYGRHKVLLTYQARRTARCAVQSWPNVFELQDTLPEDLCFYRKGEAWFITVTHEKLAWAEVQSRQDEAFFRPFALDL